jgi:hypothetical protein
VAATKGDFAPAFERGVEVATAFVAVALVIAVIDIVVDRKIAVTPPGREAVAPEQ